jgi:SAM-dependent methyltransferase
MGWRLRIRKGIKGKTLMKRQLDDWDYHWTRFKEAAGLGPAPKYRRRLIGSLFKMSNKGESVRMLEIGSGTGEFAAEFCARYPQGKFLGIELSGVGVETSSQLAPSACFLQRDLLLAPASDEGLDFGATHAVCSEVLEPVKLLRSATSYMQPGCRLIVTVPGGPMNAFYKHIGHRRHYSPGEMKQLLESAGFRVERSIAAGFPFFNLFRMFLTIRGEKLIKNISGKPSFIVKVGMAMFDVLFRLNLLRWGWQTVAIARWEPS